MIIAELRIPNNIYVLYIIIYYMLCHMKFR